MTKTNEKLTVKEAHALFEEGGLLLEENKISREEKSRLASAMHQLIKSGIVDKVTESEMAELDKATAINRKLKNKTKGEDTKMRFEKVMDGLASYSCPHITVEVEGMKHTKYLKPGQSVGESDIQHSIDFVKNFLHPTPEKNQWPVKISIFFEDLITIDKNH